MKISWFKLNVYIFKYLLYNIYNLIYKYMYTYVKASKFLKL